MHVIKKAAGSEPGTTASRAWSRWLARRAALRAAREEEQQAILRRCSYDLRGLDYSDHHSPRSMEAYLREKRLQSRVTWSVMTLVFIILGVALFL